MMEKTPLEETIRPPAPSMVSTAAPTPIRPGTPSSLRNPFEPQPQNHHPSHAVTAAGVAVPTDPFSTPVLSRPASSLGSSNAAAAVVVSRFEQQSQRYFHSRRVRGKVEKPWLEKTDPKEKWLTILPILGILVGLGVSGFLVWDGIRSVVRHNYCLVLDDDFSRGLNTDVWNVEIQSGGFGTGQFDVTTDSPDNVFVDADSNLNIKATLQDAALLEKDTVIDLLADGRCTASTRADCVTATNTTAGNSSVVNPALSGRLNTKGRATIKYGRVEVTARLPQGDWLWPAIWMMPEQDTYGGWPASGEIDIMESRGNNWTYEHGGNDIVSSSLHWGPTPDHDGWWRTNNKRQALHTTFSADFHTFGLEWSEKYLFTYLDSRLLQVMYANFDQSLWERGDFPVASDNGTFLRDPWGETGRKNTPFDQPFYLVLNLAVGSRNGWFEDAKSDKPWLDASENAPKDFWFARDRWYPTWTRPEMKISRVVMWQQCNGGEL